MKRPFPSFLSFFQKIGSIGSLQVFQVLQFSATVLIGVLLAKSGLPSGQISIYEALLFVSGLFCFYWIAGGQHAWLQIFPKLDESAQLRSLFNVYLLFTLFGIASAGLLLLSEGLINKYLTSFGDLPFLDLLALFLLFNSPTFLIQYIYLFLKNYRAIAVFGAVAFGLQVVVVAIPIYMGLGLRAAILGLVVWAVAKYIWGVLLVWRHGLWKVDVVFLKKYLVLLSPLLLFGLIGKGADYVGGLMVGSLFSDESLFAVYRYGAREFPLAVVLVGALATSLVPEVSADTKAGMKRIKETTRRLSHWLYPISIFSILASPIVFPVVFSPVFKESAYLFNIFTLLLTSRIVLPQVVAMGHGKNYVLTLSALVELFVLAGLAWWWGSLFGLRGVAYATVAAFFLDRAILVLYNWKWLGIPLTEYVDLRSYVFYNVLLVGSFLLSLLF